MNISKITQPISKAATNLGDKLNGNSKIAKNISKAISYFEPNGGDNSFMGLVTIMSCFVVVPRVLSALKRNPGNKEATRDEVKEILFRDLQTIAIILFGLKSMQAVASSIVTKITKIPMVENPYKNVFGKGSETISQRARNFCSNISSTLSPFAKGTKAMSSETVQNKYMNLNSREEIIKLLDSVESQGGKKEAVFEKIRKSALKHIDSIIKTKQKSGQYSGGKLSTQAEIDELMQKRKFFAEDLKLQDFMDQSNYTEGISSDCMSEMVRAMQNEDTNALAKSVNGLNSYLKTAALGIEVGYLGFGLPFLNKKRLEKKYLSEKPLGTQVGDTFSPINDRHIKAQEIKLYSNFIK